MDRQQAIRDHFSERHPETIFVTKPPNKGGFYFAHRGEDNDLFPIVSIFTLWDRTAELDDDDFVTMLDGLSAIIGMFYEITDGRFDHWPAEMRPAIWDLIRRRMIEEHPAEDAVLARVLDVT